MDQLEWHTGQRRINDLIPYEFNPRVLTEEKKKFLIESIEKYGLVEIPAINLDNTLLAGHQRCKVLQLIGRGDELIDVRIPNRMLTKKEAKEYNVRSNISIGDWDTEVLDKVFGDIDFVSLGLNMADMQIPDSLMNIGVTPNTNERGPEETEDLPVLTENEPLVKIGHLFQLGAHILICGDSTSKEVVSALISEGGGQIPNIMVTDPPYGVKLDQTWRNGVGSQRHNGNANVIKNDDIADWTTAYALFGGDVAYVWHATKFTDVIMKNLRDCNFEPNQMLILNKSVLVMGRNDYHWKHEPCWYAIRKGKTHSWIGDRKNTTVIDAIMPSSRAQKSDETRTEHPTQKPLKCMSIPIMNHSGNVYDPFLGSGTTLIAAEQLNRKCLGIELDPKYCEIIILRWANYMQQQNKEIIFKHINGSLSLEDIRANAKQ